MYTIVYSITHERTNERTKTANGRLRYGGEEFFTKMHCIEGVVAPWCNPLTLQPEQSGGVGSNPGRAPPLERCDKGRGLDLDLLR